MVYAFKSPRVLSRLFPDILWKYKSGPKKLYLSFDDGPTPEVTAWVLDLLAQYQCKATFFCIGRKVSLHPQIYAQILRQGHAVGNHSYSHFNGWSSNTANYLRDVNNARDQINSNLFRPPYGRLKPSQYQQLKKQFRIVCWDVLSGDFDPKLSQEDCWTAIKQHCEDGSIIVFHDIRKTWTKLQFVLPRMLSHYLALGYSFESINFKA